MTYNYKTQGTCSRCIDIEVCDEIIKDVKFTGGCNGNLKGIAALIKGKNINEIIPVLKGIKCGFKDTSCPDQLAVALEQIRDEM